MKGITDRTLGLGYSRTELTAAITNLVAERDISSGAAIGMKDYIQNDIKQKSPDLEMLSIRKPTSKNASRIEYLKNCIDANLATLNSFEKLGVLTFNDFENRFEKVSERTGLLNMRFDDLQKRILKICGMSSLFRYFNIFEAELIRMQRKYTLLHNYFDESSTHISTLQRVDRVNNNMFSVRIKNIKQHASKRLTNIRYMQALLSNMIDNGISAETEYPLIKNVSVDPLSSIAKMRSHPDYTAAKAGDSDAAFRLVNEIFTGEEQKRKIKELGSKYPDAIIVGVYAVEAAGKNKIPLFLAKKISELSGIEYDPSIIQINKVGRTDSSAVYRLAHRPKFAGTVHPGRQYILADDVITAGGTLSELRSYIEGRGGEVVHLVTGGAAAHSTNFALSAKTRFALESKHGIIPLMNFVKDCDIYGGKLEYLTESEGSELLRFKSLDTARDRIIEERYGRSFEKIR